MRIAILATIVALLVALNAGCASDPELGHPCAPGHARDGDLWCVLPSAEIAIDGDDSDWSGVTELPLVATCTAPPCDLPTPTGIRMVTHRNVIDTSVYFESLSLLIDLGAPAPAGSDVRVGVRLRSPAELPVTREVDGVFLHDGGVQFERDAYEILGTGGYAARATPTGLEVQLQSRWVPFSEAAAITVVVERWDGAAWIPAVTAAPLPACWGSSPLRGFRDPCELFP